MRCIYTFPCEREAREVARLAERRAQIEAQLRNDAASADAELEAAIARAAERERVRLEAEDRGYSPARATSSCITRA